MRQTIIYTPNKITAAIVFIVSILFLYFFYQILVVNQPNSDTEKSTIAYLFTALFLVVASFGILQAFIRLVLSLISVPKLELSIEGIRYKTVLSNKLYHWKDVGPFTLIESGSRKHRVRTLYAHTDMKHDLQYGASASSCASSNNADIKLNITWLNTPTDVADTINQWRNEYGSPKDDTYHLTASQKQDMLKDLQTSQRKQQLIRIIIGLTVIAACYYYLVPMVIRALNQ
ncbi:hypothetical protein [Kordiimonas laminariae]|uniref:hypothetical protein n=1 Tax=Kordiimonas laminariae TaxID=2917717 RepID=UPI001FF3B7DF|nr:hypothetical protein [Kordiimonas laminariae]MCK0069828.1 hypothetical protein [Kordiimonas laminariae]